MRISDWSSDVCSSIYEIAKKWANALAHAFGVSEQAFARRVGEIVTSDLGVPVRNWDDDPRAKRGIYRTYGRRTRELTALREYQAESAISIFLGELRSRSAERRVGKRWCQYV